MCARPAKTWWPRCAAIVALRNALRRTVHVEAGVSTAFGCTLQGAVPEDEVVRLAAALAEAGADEIGLSDTTGMANPAQVRRLFTGCAPKSASNRRGPHAQHAGPGPGQLPGGV
jgi:hydroxymethylglutaryl-CoA lyase